MRSAARRNALRLIDDIKTTNGRITLSADKGYDTRDFIADPASAALVPHVLGTPSHARATVRSVRLLAILEGDAQWKVASEGTPPQLDHSLVCSRRRQLTDHARALILNFLSELARASRR